MDSLTINRIMSCVDGVIDPGSVLEEMLASEDVSSSESWLLSLFCCGRGTSLSKCAAFVSSAGSTFGIAILAILRTLDAWSRWVLVGAILWYGLRQEPEQEWYDDAALWLRWAEPCESMTRLLPLTKCEFESAETPLMTHPWVILLWGAVVGHVWVIACAIRFAVYALVYFGYRVCRSLYFSFIAFWYVGGELKFGPAECKVGGVLFDKKGPYFLLHRDGRQIRCYASVNQASAMMLGNGVGSPKTEKGNEMAVPGNPKKVARLPAYAVQFVVEDEVAAHGFRVGNVLYTAVHVLKGMLAHPDVKLYNPNAKKSAKFDRRWKLVVGALGADVAGIEVPMGIWSGLCVKAGHFAPLKATATVMSHGMEDGATTISYGNVMGYGKTPFSFIHSCTTCEGDSGGPITTKNGIVGMHLGADLDKRLNRAVWMSPWGVDATKVESYSGGKENMFKMPRDEEEHRGAREERQYEDSQKEDLYDPMFDGPKGALTQYLKNGKLYKMIGSKDSYTEQVLKELEESTSWADWAEKDEYDEFYGSEMKRNRSLRAPIGGVEAPPTPSPPPPNQRQLQSWSCRLSKPP